MATVRTRVSSLRRVVVGLAAALVAVVGLAGCLTVGYVVQAGLGQLRLFGDARPIDEVLADPTVDRRTKALLAEVPGVLEYAAERGLDSQGNYTKYVELDRPSVVWFMAASEPLAFEPKVWSFPIVGSFTYVGWFNRQEARTIKRILEADGWDVYVRTVRAYSTGGWFRDPVLSSMLSDDEAAFSDLVHVLIHELVHANILIRDQSTFNESVAKFVGDTMAEEYLAARTGDDSPTVQAFRDELAERKARGEGLARSYAALAALYDSDVDDSKKLAEKKRILDEVEAELRLPSPINNASLLNFKTYNAGIPEFARLYQACDRDWPRFFTAVGALETDSFAKEQQDDIAPVIAGLVTRGCPARDAGTTATGPVDRPARGTRSSIREQVGATRPSRPYPGSLMRSDRVLDPECRSLTCSCPGKSI